MPTKPLPLASDAAALLQALARDSPDAIFAKDAQGRYILFNPEAERIVGKAAADVLGRDDSQLFGPQVASTIRTNDSRVMVSNRAESFEETILTQAGERVYLSTKGPLHDATGQVSGTFGVSRDITEMAATRARLADSEERYRMLFRSSPAALCVHEPATGRFLAVNHAAEALYGYSREEFLSKTWSSLQVRQGDDAQHRCRDGRVIDVETVANDVHWDHTPARLTQVTDVTARHHAEAERQAASERFQKLFQAAPDPISLTEMATGRFLQVNAAFCQVFGYEEAQLLGRSAGDLQMWTRPQDRQDLLARLQAGESVRDFEVESRRRDGTRIPVAFSADKVNVAGRDCLLLVFRDITRRKQAESELRRSEQRFRLAASTGQVWEWDFAGGPMQPPAEFFERLGHRLAPGTLLDALATIVPPEDMEDMRRRLRRHLQQQGPYHHQFRARDADGRLRWFETQGQAVWNAEGRAVYMAGTTFDITDRHRAEQALLDSQSELYALSQRLLHQERDTNQRLAQSLHDRLGQSLGSARLHLDLLRESLGDAPQATGRPLQRLTQLLDLAVAEVRSTLVALRPPLLEAQGLAASLRVEMAELLPPQGPVSARLDVTPQAEACRWPADVEFVAFMVAREALSNVLRHAQASSVRVTLSGSQQQLTLNVRDNGVGIAAELLQGRPGHLGVVGMRERALGIGARLHLGPPQGLDRGTEVTLRWPGHGAQEPL